MKQAHKHQGKSNGKTKPPGATGRTQLPDDDDDFLEPSIFGDTDDTEWTAPPISTRQLATRRAIEVVREELALRRELEDFPDNLLH